MTLRYGDPLVMDRWRWLKARLKHGVVRTFDAGCGNGCFSFAAGARGNEVVAASFDAGSLEKARFRSMAYGMRNVTFVQVNLCELDKKEQDLGFFDQIICTECIEHIHDDAKLLRDLARCLKPGGRILLTTPEASHQPLRHEARLLTEPGGHVRWGYTAVQLEALFAQAGLTVVEVSYTSGWISQMLTNLMRVRHERLVWICTYPLRVLQPFDRVTNHILGFPWFGVTIIGEKPVQRS